LSGHSEVCIPVYFKKMKKEHSTIVIIGAGLTGLTIAYLLKKQGIAATIIEARDRLGGRIHTQYRGKGSIEMGATWLGKKHVHLTKLLEELQLEIFEQFMDERAIYEHMSFSAPQLVQLPPNSDPSFRIKGGTSQLIQQLAAQLDEHQIQLNQAVKSIHFTGEKVQLSTSKQDFEADHVITTLPPKLLVSSIQFTPALPKKLLDIAEKTHTWMGESIKVGLSYPKAFWRAKQTSGTIFSNAGPITEMYDHSTFEKGGFALKGFMNGAFHGASQAERKQQVVNQLKKYYGKTAEEFLTYEECVWSQEKYTYAPYEGYVLPHQNNGNAIFRKKYYAGRLIVAGSETAESFPGYMDGAVYSAQWVLTQLTGTLQP
jgi:monoamine oxidase